MKDIFGITARNTRYIRDKSMYGRNVRDHIQGVQKYCGPQSGIKEILRITARYDINIGDHYKVR